MTTQERTTEKSLLQEIGNKLQMARQELDEFAVQLALGKAEAKDKYEDLRKDFIERLGELTATHKVEGKKDEVRKKIKALEAHLHTRGIDEKKHFEERIENILTALEAAHSIIRIKLKTVQQRIDFDHEVEMFRLKLEILRLRFGLKKFEVRENFRSRMEEARKKIEAFTSKAKEKIEGGKEKYIGFSDEIQLTYKHFRKSLEALQH